MFQGKSVGSSKSGASSVSSAHMNAKAELAVLMEHAANLALKHAFQAEN